MDTRTKSEMQACHSSFKEMQDSLNSLQSESDRLLNEGFALQMECYLKGNQQCIEDYNQMRLKLESIKRHKAVDEMLCLKSVPDEMLKSFKSKITLEETSLLKYTKKCLKDIRNCMDFSKSLINDEIDTIKEGIKVTKAHLSNN